MPEWLPMYTLVCTMFRSKVFLFPQPISYILEGIVMVPAQAYIATTQYMEIMA